MKTKLKKIIAYSLIGAGLLGFLGCQKLPKQQETQKPQGLQQRVSEPIYYFNEASLRDPIPEEIKPLYDFCKKSKLTYFLEEGYVDYWKAPYETEKDGKGDCEDLSIWLSYQLKKLGYDAWLANGKAPRDSHIWVRVRINKNIYDADLTYRFIRKTSEETSINSYYQQKFQEAMDRQKEYEMKNRN